MKPGENLVYRCLNCDCQGVIFATRKTPEEGTSPGEFYVFLCGCTWGRADIRSYPRWNSHYAKTYEISKTAGTPLPRDLPAIS